MDIREKFVAQWKSTFSDVTPPDLDFSIDSLKTTLDLQKQECLLKKQELLKLEFVVNFLQKIVDDKSNVEESGKMNVHHGAESESRHKVPGQDQVSENRPETEPTYSLSDGIRTIVTNTKTSITVGLMTGNNENSKPKNDNKFAKLRPAPKPPVQVGPVVHSGQEKFELKFEKQETKENAGKTFDTFGKPISGPRWSISSRSKSQSESVSDKQECEKNAKPSVPPRISSHLTYTSEQTKNIPTDKMVKFSEKEPEISSRSSSTPSSPRPNQMKKDELTDKTSRSSSTPNSPRTIKMKMKELSDKITDESSDDNSDIGKCIDELKEMKKQEEMKSTATGLDSVNNQVISTGNVARNTNFTEDFNTDTTNKIPVDKNNGVEEEDIMRRSNGVRISRNVDDLLIGTKYSELDFSSSKRDVKFKNDLKSVSEDGSSNMTYVQLSRTKRGRNKSAPNYENVSLDFILTKCNQSDESTSDSDENYEDVETRQIPPILESDIDSVCDSIRQDKPMKPPVESNFEGEDDLYDNAVPPCDDNDVTPTPESVSSTSSWTFVPSENVNYESGGRDSVFIAPLDVTDGNDGQGEKASFMRKKKFIEENGVLNAHCKEKTQIKETPEDKERTRKLHMRQILVKGVLESEKTYLKILEQITEFKRTLQNSIGKNCRLCSPEDITTIFYKVEEIHKHHKTFVEKLEDKVYSWCDEQQIGDSFKELIVFFPMYMEYVNNSVQAKKTIQKCCEENQTFKDMAMKVEISSSQISSEKETTTLEEILFKPVQRLQRNTLVLHDLLEHTPIDHPDYKVLKSALDLSDHNLRTFSSPDHASDVIKSEDQRHLVKSGFVIEMDGRSRKLRFLFLFSDVIVCTKHKPSRNRSKPIECKWFVPISSVVVESSTQDDQKYHCKDDIDALKKKIVNLKADLRQELKQQKLESKERSWSFSSKVSHRSIEKLQKKIEDQEGALILSSPHLPLQLTCTDDTTHPHTILMSTDFEREEWKDAINKQQQQHSMGDSVHLNIHSVQDMINNNASKLIPQVNQIGNVLMNKDEEMLSGMLNVTIHTLNGLDKECDTYCQLDLDSYGHFFMKARTHVCCNTTEPAWDEDFELDLDGSQSLRILLYKKSTSGGSSDVLIGRSALELSQSWLKSSFQEQKISMNQISLTISIRHTPSSKTLKRTPSRHQGGIFGVRIGAVIKREGKTVPLFVTACVKEVEKRGLQEVGIYRVSGVTSEIQRLKNIFDKNIRQGINMIAESDIHAVTGVLKLYFRELPEPLFTDLQYKHFISTLELNDSDSKEKCMLQLLHDLPNENYYTAVYMIEHLVKAGKYVSENKMSLSNLATVFGPTLLHPAVRDSMANPALMMMREAQDVILQSGVLSYFLDLVSKGKSIRRSSSV